MPSKPERPAHLNFGFGTPWQAQIDFLRNKLNLPTDRWDDIMRRAHDKAFVVAGAAKADLLKDLHEAVIKAAEGVTFEDFRKNFKALVAKNGWTGWTGEGSADGEAWRTKIIYSTNLTTSYWAGQYARYTDPEYLKIHPYWRYIHKDGVLHPRPHHLAWHGLTLPHDHPFWKTHFAPNGWMCHCRITTVSRAEGEASARAGLGEPPAGWDAINPKTGAQVGIDKGFDYAPGATWHPNMDKYPGPLARQVVQANLRDGVFDRWVKKINDNVATELATGAYANMDSIKTSNALRIKLGEQGSMPIAILDATTRDLLAVKTQVVLVSDFDLIKQAVSRKGEYDAMRYMAVQELIDNLPYIAKQANGRYFLVPEGSKVPVAVIHATADGKELYLKSYREGYGPKEIARSAAKDEVLRALSIK